MGAYALTLESDTPPQISVGQKIGGATVKELKALDQKLVSASDLAEKYSVSTDTIRRKLASINQGTSGKFLYNPILADTLFKESSKTKRGRKRAQ